MAHRALTLKYRPQVFADMIGQDHVSSVLGRALETGRVAHAYLLTGARGVGKTTSARILAKALNCQKRASGEHPGADPCNVCTSCTEITSGVSLDVSEIDGASNRGIADVQALREKVRFAPTGGRHRVVIIDEVHQLSNDAFAALLKTLEEPPPHLVFIFATTDPQKLPDTIRSRTQRFDFARVALRKVADRLIELQKREAADPDGVKFHLTEGAALLIAHKSEGSMRDAVSGLDQVVSAGEAEVNEELVRRVLGLADREAFFALAEAIVSRDPRAALRSLHEAFAKGIDARELAEGLGEHLRHVLVLKIDPASADLVAASAEDLERLRAQSKDWSENDLLRLLRIGSEVLFPMRDSPQPLLHLEAAVLQMATLEAGETLGEILARLEALERRLGGGGAAPAPSVGGAPRATASGSAASARVADPPTAGRAAAPPVRTGGVPPGSLPPRAQSGPSAFDAMRAAASQGATARPPAPAAAPPPAPVARAASAPAATSAPVAVLPVATEVAVTDEPLLRNEQIERCWKETITAINGRKRMLGAFLEESVFLGKGPAGLVVAMDDLHRAVVEEKDNRTLMAEEVARAFGEAVAVTCAPMAMAAPAKSAADVKAMVDQTVAWFGGEAPARPARRDERTDA